jgi:hypothetical protein
LIICCPGEKLSFASQRIILRIAWADFELSE